MLYDFIDNIVINIIAFISDATDTLELYGLWDKDLSSLYIMFNEWSFTQLGAYLDKISRNIVEWFKGKVDTIKKLR